MQKWIECILTQTDSCIRDSVVNDSLAERIKDTDHNLYESKSRSALQTFSCGASMREEPEAAKTKFCFKGGSFGDELAMSVSKLDLVYLFPRDASRDVTQ